MLLSYVNRLPNEIVIMIKDFIPKSIFSLLSKDHYLFHFPEKQLYLENNYNIRYPHYNGSDNSHKSYDSYIRFIIRNDSNFIFENILKMNYDKWCKIKKWSYKNLKFKNYIQYILYLCQKYTSGKCKNIIKYSFKYK